MTEAQSRKRVVAIIVARMGSTRLPGKHLRRLGEKTLLGRLIDRLRRCETLDDIVLATSGARDNAPLAVEAASYGVRTIFHPEEDDVLGRIAAATRVTAAEVTVTVLGDTPLVDPAVVDTSVRALLESDADEAVGDPALGPTLVTGVDVRTADAIDRLDRASFAAQHREHAGLYAKENPDFLRAVTVAVPEDLRRHDLRLTVDTPADLKLMERLHEALGPRGEYVDLRDAIDWLDEHGDVRNLNAHVRQRAAVTAPRPILISCAGGPGVGLGHLRRMSFLAAALRDEHGLACHFVIPDDERLLGRLEAASFNTTPLPRWERRSEELLRLADTSGAPLVILDWKSEVPRSLVESLHEAGRRVVVVDQASEGARAADIALLPVAHSGDEGVFTSAQAELIAGAPYVLLDPMLTPAPARSLHRRPRVLVTTGSSDPHRLVLTALDGLVLLARDLDITVVIGDHCSYGDIVEERALTLGAHIERAPASLAPLLRWADLVIATFGVTAYECARVGAPTVLLANDDDAAEDAARFARFGTAITLGVPDEATPVHLTEIVADLLHDKVRTRSMRRAGLAWLDGRGASRAASALAKLVVRPDVPALPRRKPQMDAPDIMYGRSRVGGIAV